MISETNFRMEFNMAGDKTLRNIPHATDLQHFTA